MSCGPAAWRVQARVWFLIVHPGSRAQHLQMPNRRLNGRAHWQASRWLAVFRMLYSDFQRDHRLAVDHTDVGNADSDRTATGAKPGQLKGTRVNVYSGIEGHGQECHVRRVLNRTIVSCDVLDLRPPTRTAEVTFRAGHELQKSGRMLSCDKERLPGPSEKIAQSIDTRILMNRLRFNLKLLWWHSSMD